MRTITNTKRSVRAFTILFLSLFCLHIIAGGYVDMVVPVYTQELNLDTYLYYGPNQLPAMSEHSYCMWYYGLSDGDNRASDFLISYALDDNNNEMYAGFATAQTYQMIVGGTSINLGVETAETNDARLIGWHRHCWTWKANGEFRWYTTRLSNDNEMELWKYADAGSGTMRGGGSLTIMQEQDVVLGSFDVSQIMAGRVALFNMWDRELTSQEIQAVGCRAEGNLITMSDLLIGGQTDFSEEAISCGTAQEAFDLDSQRLNKIHHSREQTISLCRVNGAKLSNHVMDTVSTDSVRVCALRCAKHTQCLSANFIVSTTSCELNSATAPDWNIKSDDYDDQLDADDYIHYTSHITC